VFDNIRQLISFQLKLPVQVVNLGYCCQHQLLLYQRTIPLYADISSI